jgi:hypothetical protein
MQAAVVPAVNGSWQVKDVPQPQPGPNQVLVKMHASGICYTDVHQSLGHFPGPFPRILGHEPVGEIVAVAPDVTTRKIGDLLLPLSFSRGQSEQQPGQIERRLISLIFAGRNRIIMIRRELPLTVIAVRVSLSHCANEDSLRAWLGCFWLCARNSERCSWMIVFAFPLLGRFCLCFGYCQAAARWLAIVSALVPMAQMKPNSSRATAVVIFLLSLPAAPSFK